MAILAILLTAPAAQAATNTWVTAGPSTNYWTNGANWSSGFEPTNGEDVLIISNNVGVLLTTSTYALASLTISNKATLIFSNWDTILTATNVTILTNGVMTLPSAFANTNMSNNIYIVCTGISIAAGGKIDADSKGYRGNSAAAYSGGDGPGGGTNGGGGGYGGNGGASSIGGSGGQTYGSASAPIAPGSGGSLGLSGAAAHGGGAIRIQATSGTVTVNGTITANGGTGSSSDGGGGSGGGIYITCSALAGSGTLSANGGSCGDRYAGAGGGGRIAVIYDPAAQSNIVPAPAIRFTANANMGYTAVPSGLGTLYCPDNYFLIEPLQHSGVWLAPGFTAWSPNNLTVSNAWIRFPADGFQLTVTNDITVRGTNAAWHKFELTNADVTCGGNLLLTNAALILYASLTSGPSLNCGSNLTMAKGGALYVYNSLTNGGSVTNWSALISVTGDVSIATNAWIYPYAHPTNGSTALFRMRDLSIAAGGGFNAQARGYLGQYPRGYGPGGGTNGAGGGYGGMGGGGYTGYAGGQTYGSSNVPIEPGSGGGVMYSGAAGDGGGAVRIQASRSVTIDGTITANGGAGSGNDGGGGAGGGVYITCRTFGGAGSLSAKGGSTGTRYVGGGGGGRIAVWRMYGGSVTTDVSGGIEYGTTGTDGTNGTVVWGWIPVPGTIFTMH